ncbi:MAG: tetratricopeptide repeat protein [Epsilonproteobacteria bacterium]|nr:hypothetical protein [Campylobacterota bacterium]NPA56510.1 tetratricopeptide repeat protein [Campylobacterota bacterium]
MQRYYIGLIAALLLIGCSTRELPALKRDEAKINSYLFKAIFLEANGAYDEAARLYRKLYKMTGSHLFLKKIIANNMAAKRYEESIELLQKALREDPDNLEYLDLLAQTYYALKEYKKAKEILLKLIEKRRDSKYYQMLASIYLIEKKYDQALKYYESAYAIDPSEHTINSIAYILYFYLDRPKDAIAYLESHIRIYGCQKSVCKLLASIYGLNNDIEGLISTYKRLYREYGDPEYAKKLVKLYIYQKEYDKAIDYVNELGDRDLLLDLYKAKGDYRRAYQLAEELYEERGDLHYLGMSAIFQYEMARQKDPQLLREVAEKLEKVVEKVPDPIYLNYLGYLYIDHDLDVERGVELVKRALEKEPNSPYYLDSLAWGYYKLGRCREALELIRRVYYELGLQDPEVKSHLEAIEGCLKEER